MSRFKDAYNERHYAAYEAARERGVPEHEAQAEGDAAAEGLINEYLDAADMLRKRGRGE